MKLLLVLFVLALGGCANLAPPRERVTPYLQDLHGKVEVEPSPYKPGDALLCICPPGTKLFGGKK